MPARGCQMRVPGGLAVVVGMDVDEAGGHQTAPCIDFAMAFALDHADFGDASVVDGDIGLLTRRAAAVDDGAAADHGLVSVHEVSWVISAPLMGLSAWAFDAAFVLDCRPADAPLSSRAAPGQCALIRSRTDLRRSGHPRCHAMGRFRRDNRLVPGRFRWHKPCYLPACHSLLYTSRCSSRWPVSVSRYQRG